ncbi:hypothetical protein Tco_0838982 [Tanacetum coccineum]|uniref:Uncharacterized protein n=1 Tax=Tanacetum coccineum TaxID=301880 RepID=A0ABQ5APC9_9ASTR
MTLYQIPLHLEFADTQANDLSTRHYLYEEDSGILWKLILLFPDLRVMVPLSNLITALAVVRNGVPKMKVLFSSSLMSRIMKSTGYTCSATSTKTSSAIPKG